MIRMIALFALVVATIGPTCAQEDAKLPYRLPPLETWMTACTTQAAMEEFVKTQFGAARMNETLVGTEKTGSGKRDLSCRKMLVRLTRGEVVGKMLSHDGLGVYLITKIKVIATNKSAIDNWKPLAHPLELYGADFEAALII